MAMTETMVPVAARSGGMPGMALSGMAFPGSTVPGADPAGPVVGILLAAGRGQRFDASGNRNKLLQVLPGGVAVAVQSARTLRNCLAEVVAVVAPGSEELAMLLQAEGCRVSVCADAHLGMAATLVHAIREAERLAPAGWLVGLADMPWVQPASIEALLAAGSGADFHLAARRAICAPCVQGRRGNPVLFARDHLAQLLALRGDQGARALLQQWPVTLVEVDDPGILLDIDTENDLASGPAGASARPL